MRAEGSLRRSNCHVHALGSQGREQEPGTRSQDKDKPQARLDVFSVLLPFSALPTRPGEVAG